jgi:hypothetical protein
MPNTTNETFLQQTADILSDLEVRYQEASFDEQVQLRDLLDQAMNSYSGARLTLLKNKVTSTPTDIVKMNQIKQDLDQAMDFGKLITVSTKLVSFLTSRFF